MTWLDLIKKTVIRHVDAEELDDIPKIIKRINQYADDDYKEFLGFAPSTRVAILTLMRLISLLLPKQHEGVAVFPGNEEGQIWYAVLGMFSPQMYSFLTPVKHFGFEMAMDGLGGKKFDELNPRHQEVLTRWLGLSSGDIVPKNYMPHHRLVDRRWYRKKYWKDPSASKDSKRKVYIERG